MKDTALVLVTVFGGLGVFLLGMKHLSEGLQSVAGRGLRRLMALAPINRAAGVGTGAVSTVLVQSSSVISVMIVGFVSSGLMTLQQAVSVIIGANVGTTATIWMIALVPNPDMLGYIGLGLGCVMYFFLRGERIHNLGLAVLGLGLVFLGLYFIGCGVDPIHGNSAVRNLFMKLSAVSIGGVLAVAFVSALFTAVIQSSAATIAIAMILASHRLITYETAVSVLLGANIGTTVSAWLATSAGSAAAKRTAFANTLFNIVGSVVFLPFVIPVIVPMGKALFAGWNTVTETSHGPLLLGVMMPIAFTDTVFSVFRGLLVFPFVKRFAAFVERIVKQPDGEKPHLSALKARAKLSPVIACDQALLEIRFMRDSDLELLSCARRVLDGSATPEDEEHIVHRENILDNVQREITEFLGQVMVKRLDADVAARARRLLRLTDELESVSDEAATILKVTRRLKKNGQRMSDASCAVLLSVHDRVSAFAAEISPWIRSPRPVIDIEAVQAESKEIHDFVRECRRTQLGRIGSEDPDSPMRVLVELDVINAYERVRSYYLNIAETLAGGKK